MRAAVFAAFLLLLPLAGCAGPEAQPVAGPAAELPPIQAGRGAIAGLLVDDRYRPIGGAEVVLFPVGLQAASDASGQFAFFDLEPGAYELHVQAEGHEAAPAPVDVEEGVYTEAEVEARRTFSDVSDTVTEQYSVFVPCAASAVLVAVIMKCVLDGDDSYDWGFSSDYTAYNDTTFVVSEFLASQPDGYLVTWGCDGGLADHTFEGVYTRLVLEVGGSRNGTIEWQNDCVLGATLFYVGAGSATTKEAGFSWGAGARFAVKGTFLNTVFLGPPEVDPVAHAVLRPKGQA
ncbi:MAG: Carboxypeptidase regulatory-like domain [Thermoplasmata archaeon]|jgi:hypothetical protein|nr:Carboxypeptidase regulatory-like domain [Thermoplasmata archaeon]